MLETCSAKLVYTVDGGKAKLRQSGPGKSPQGTPWPQSCVLAIYPHTVALLLLEAATVGTTHTKFNCCACGEAASTPLWASWASSGHHSLAGLCHVRRRNLHPLTRGSQRSAPFPQYHLNMVSCLQQGPPLHREVSVSYQSNECLSKMHGAVHIAHM